MYLSDRPQTPKRYMAIAKKVHGDRTLTIEEQLGAPDPLRLAWLDAGVRPPPPVKGGGGRGHDASSRLPTEAYRG